jgi:hypothetical protein
MQRAGTFPSRLVRIVHLLDHIDLCW